MTNVELSKTAVEIRLNADFGRIPVILHLKRVSSSLRQGQDITMHNDLPKSPQCVILSRSCATKGGYTVSYSVWGSLWSMHVQCANLITSFHSNTKDPVIDGCTKIVSCLRGLVYDSRKEEKKSFVAAGRTERAHLGDPGGSLSL